MGLSSSLFAGISGLQRHQLKLDVIGNNLANVNTYGYKEQRVLFQDLLYQTIKPDTAPNSNTGGTNASQVGVGVDLGTIDTNFNQGSLETTGIESDLAIEGNGFFALRDGATVLYTRDGAFTLNQERKLVNPTSGMHVQGWVLSRDNAGNATVNTGGALKDVVVPVGDSRIAKATSQFVLNGNLNGAGLLGTTGTVLNSQRLFSSKSGDTEVTAGSLDLRDVYIKDPAGGSDNVRLFKGTGSLNAENFVLTSGDRITVQVNKGGRPLEAIFSYGNGDLVNNTSGDLGPDGIADSGLEAYDGNTLNDFTRWFDKAFGLVAVEDNGASRDSNAAHGLDGDNPNDLVDMGKGGANPFTDETDGSGFKLLLANRGAAGLSGNTAITKTVPTVAIENSKRTFNLVAGSGSNVTVGSSYVDIDADGFYNPDKDIVLQGLVGYVVTGNSTVSQGGVPFASTSLDMVMRAFDISGASTKDMYIDVGKNGIYDKGVDPIVKNAFSTDVFGSTTTQDAGTPGVVSTSDGRMTITHSATGLKISKGLMATGGTTSTTAQNNAAMSYNVVSSADGPITVTLNAPAGATTSVSTTGKTITVSPSLTATQQDVVNIINNDATASKLIYATTTSAATAAAAGTNTMTYSVYTVESVTETSGTTVVTFDKAYNTSALPGAMALATVNAATNTGLTYTAKVPGTAGNSITVTLTNPGVANQALSVSVSSNAITVSLATSGASAITTTRSEIAAAINANAAAAALMTATVTANGATVASAEAAVTLAGGANASTLNYIGAALVQAGYTATSSSAQGDTLLVDSTAPTAILHPTTGNYVGKAIYNTVADNEKNMAGSLFIDGSGTYRVDLAPARFRIKTGVVITAGTTTAFTVDQINNTAIATGSTLSTLGLRTGMTIVGAVSKAVYTVDKLVVTGTDLAITFDKAIADANDFAASSSYVLNGFAYIDADNDSKLDETVYRVHNSGTALYIDKDFNGVNDNTDLTFKSSTTVSDLSAYADNEVVYTDPLTGNVYRKVPVTFDKTNRYVYLDANNKGIYDEQRFNIVNAGGTTASSVRWVIDENNDGVAADTDTAVISTTLGAHTTGTVVSIASDTATLKMPTGSVVNGVTTGSGRMQIRGNIGTTNELSGVSFISGADRVERNVFTNSALTNGSVNAATTQKSAVGESVSQNILVYDSLGTPHDVTLTFVLEQKDNDKATWVWYAETGDAAQKNGNFPAGDPRGNKPGINVGTGKAIFDNFGRFMRSEPAQPLISIPLEGLNTDSALQIKPDFKILTSFANANGSQVDVREQDGFAQGVMDRYSVSTNGEVTGIYTNGLREVVAVIALAAFANPDGLIRQGGNSYAVSSNSGNAMIGTALTGERGAIRSKTLEASNVDITKEFTNLITTQRAYQANSRVITKSDEMLQELLQIVR